MRNIKQDKLINITTTELVLSTYFDQNLISIQVHS